MPQVVILCGGAGTRLSELTEVVPKPMVRIGEKPILWHIMKLFSGYGFDEFVMCLGYKGEQIRDYFAKYSLLNSDLRVEIGAQRTTVLDSVHDEGNWNVILAETGETTPTGGRIKRAAKYIEGDRFLVTYGDGLADIDVGHLLAFHRAHGRLATVTAVHPTARYGELDLLGDLVVEFREKPALVQSWVNGGFLVLEREALKYLDDTLPLEVGPLQKLALDGQLMAFRHEGFWHSMDTLRDVRALNDMWTSGAAPWLRRS